MFQKQCRGAFNGYAALHEWDKLEVDMTMIFNGYAALHDWDKLEVDMTMILLKFALHTHISCVGTWFKRASWNWVYHVSECRYVYGCFQAHLDVKRFYRLS